MVNLTKSLAFLLLLGSALSFAAAPVDNVPLQSQLYGMSKLSIPERSQDSFLNKLQSILRNNLDPHSEALANILLADYYIHVNEPLRAREHLNIANPLVNTVDLPSLYQEYNYILMLVLRTEGKLIDAKHTADALYRDVREAWPDNKLSDIVLERAYLNSYMYRYQDAFELMELALSHAYESNDPFQLVETYNVFAILYGALNDYPSAIDYLKKSIEIMESNPQYTQNTYLYVNLADAYRASEQFDLANQYLEKSLQISKETDDISLKAYAHQVKGRLLIDQENYEAALSQILQSQQLHKQVGEELFSFDINTELTQIYLELGQLDKANQHLALSKEYAQQLGSQDTHYINRLESELSFARGNFESAYELLNESYTQYRKQFNDNLTYVSNLSREQLDQERLVFENKLLEQENKLNAQYVEESRKYSYILWVLILLLLSVVAVALWIMLRYRSLARANHQMAFTDNLTKMPNRRHVFRTLELQHKASGAGRKTYSVILFDIDFFKSINDRFGHNIGDKVIQSTRDICEAVLRETDTIGRIGGEEFLVLLPDTEIKAAYAIAERLREYFETYNFDEIAPGLTVTSSFGVTEYLPEDETLDLVVNRADRLLYKAKNEGRNQVIASFA
ncbi:MAG: diguanylate cyclase [Kangiella sp.]|nr:diguanylate cyclase [Kangiella sp.]